MTIAVTRTSDIFDDDLQDFVSINITTQSDGILFISCKNTTAYGKIDFYLDPQMARVFAETILEHVTKIESKG